MTEWKRLFIGAGLALGALAAGAGAATSPAMTKQAFQAARQRIEAQARTEQAACKRQRGNAREFCELQAKGREQVAQAQLQAQYQPSPEAGRRAEDAKAEADFALAKARCKGAWGHAKDACLQQAKQRRDAAERLAVVQKVEKLRQLENARKDPKPARQETPQQKLAAQKAFCQIQGPDRDRCMAELKRRFPSA